MTISNSKAVIVNKLGIGPLDHKYLSSCLVVSNNRCFSHIRLYKSSDTRCRDNFDPGAMISTTNLLEVNFVMIQVKYMYLGSMTCSFSSSDFGTILL